MFAKDHHGTDTILCQFFLQQSLFIFHLKDSFFYAKALAVLAATKEYEVFSRTGIAIVRTMMKGTSHLNFLPTSLADENYKHLTGLSREQFADLLHLQRMQSTESRSLRTCKSVFDKTMHRSSKHIPIINTNHQYFRYQFTRFRE